MNLFKKTAVLLTAASMLTVNIFGYMPINSFKFPTFTASATEMVESGECGAQGDNLTWILDNEGTLTISGKGDMMNWKIGSSPWNEDDII
ncbi:MAG: leucine-rich repeat domain-containing protein, partial [Ruminococcus sp.]|nr:leucine-rich repeat domain-containing protein [Ruminococcus sp.]